jgi:hypothetical protein
MVRFLTRFVVAAIAFCVANLFGILAITYRSPIDNDPLLKPIQITRFDDDEISLADGRSVKTLLGIAPYWKDDSESHESADIEIDTSNRVTVYGKKRIFYCGIGDPFIVLPLIPVHVNKWQRASIASGEIDGLPVTATGTPCEGSDHLANHDGPDF